MPKAVLRSREKAKQRTKETKKIVDDLKIKNKILEENIKKNRQELTFLKELFYKQAEGKNIDMEELFKDDNKQK